MIIDNAAIKMQSEHRQHQLTEYKESLQLWNTRAENRSKLRAAPVQKDQLKFSDTGKAASTKKTQLDLEEQPDAVHALAIEIIRRMVKELTGKELKLFSPHELQNQADEVSVQEPLQPPTQQADSGAGLVYEQSMSYFESETTTFNAEGTIKTKDGQDISFSVSLNMSRSFYLESNVSLRAGDAAKTDPLVINFDGNAAELTTTTFQFDIDANGSLDQIAMLKSNSGMLALDKNHDGKINDGSELFGPKSGDGFADLAQYDDDHNGFIDEADAIYQQLRIWQHHADGSEQLLALGDKNIGAIYLGHVTTPFQLNAPADNRSLGEVASSGIYLREDGQVGTVQQINFSV
jgi:hypothetical protein